MNQGQVFKEEEQNKYITGYDPYKIPQLKIKLAEGATMPTKANPSDSGYDLTATSVRYDEQYGFLEYGTGVFLEIPKGYEVNLLPRSSISKYDLIMCNSPGKVDQEYRRELLFRYKVTQYYQSAKMDGEYLKCVYFDGTAYNKLYPTIYKVGDKIGQMEMRKKHEYELVEVSEVEDEGRGNFGSSGV